MISLKELWKGEPEAPTDAMLGSRAAALQTRPRPFNEAFMRRAARDRDLSTAGHEMVHAVVAIVLGLPFDHAAIVTASTGSLLGGYVTSRADAISEERFRALSADFDGPWLRPDSPPHHQIAHWAAYLLDDLLGVNSDYAYRDRWTVTRIAEEAVGGPGWVPCRGPRPAVQELIATGEQLTIHLLRTNWEWFERATYALRRERRLTLQQIRELSRGALTR